MKLYYSSGACSLAPHIALNEANLSYEAIKIDLATKKTATGEDYFKINPKGYVPALGLEEDQVLTECAVLLQYIAAQSPNVQLAPKEGTFEFYRFKEWLNFVATEMHKGVGFFFRKNLPEEVKNEALQYINKRFKLLEQHLSQNAYLMGDNFTLADAYLFTILRWTFNLKIDLSSYPSLLNYFEKVKNRPLVQKTLEEEGIKG